MFILKKFLYIQWYWWGEHFQKSFYPLLLFYIQENPNAYSQWETTYSYVRISKKDFYEYERIFVDIKRISHEYVWGYVVDIKEFLWIYLDNLTQDRWRRGQCPIPVRGPATVIAAALIWLSVQRCPRGVYSGWQPRHVIVCPQRSGHVGPQCL